MISDDTKGNITTILTWLSTMLCGGFGGTAIANNEIGGIVGLILAVILNYNNMKFNNTYMQPVNAKLTETDKFDGELDERAA